ncbi:hypothetical protein RB213_009252, partial [Colletotrichum asianum]
MVVYPAESRCLRIFVDPVSIDPCAPAGRACFRLPRQYALPFLKPRPTYFILERRWIW